MSSNNNDKDFPTINIDIEDRRNNERTYSKPAKEPLGDNHPSSGSGSGGKALAIIALLFGLASSGAAAFLYQELVKANSQVASAEQRLASLEDKLSATGEEMGNSTVALQVKVTELTNKSTELWDQMDKLWASAWRRNQQEIKTLDRQVKSVRSDTQSLLEGIDSKIQETDSNAQQLIARIDGINGKLNIQANDILTASVSAEQAADFSRRQTDKIDELNEKIQLLEKRNGNLLTKLSEIEVQLRELATKTVSSSQLTNNGNAQRTRDSD